MSYTVDFHNVSTVGLESSPVAAALAGLRAHEARYFKNKYDHTFTVEPASDAGAAVDWVHRILKEERDLAISSRPLEATAFQVENNSIPFEKVLNTMTIPPSPSRLSSGQSLGANQSLTAGTYRLTMQSGGNLVEYQGTKALWGSGTAGHSGTRVTMQADGNLVEYQGGHAIWASGTAGHAGAHRTLQGSDGNVVIYGPGGKALWATGT